MMQLSARSVFWALAAALLPAMLLASPDFGATWDEPQQRAKAHGLLAYWSGASPRLYNPIDGAHLYGAPFDVVSAWLEKRVAADPYVIRHAVNAAVGWAGLVLTGLLAVRLFSWRYGVLAMLLLAVHPRYIAHAMNNPKDLPFATFAAALLLIMTFVRRPPPFMSTRTALTFGLVLGLALNVRAGALLFGGYLVILVGYYHYTATKGTLTLQGLLVPGARMGGALVLALAIGWIAWPWAYEHPLTASFRALGELSRFPWPGDLLFEGDAVPAMPPPFDYVPRWIWLGTPPVLLLGIALSVAMFARAALRDRLTGLWAAALFPVLTIVLTRSTLYDELRHLLFVLPIAAVLGSAGWIGLLGSTNRAAAAAGWTVLAVGLLEPAWFQWRNHPHQTAYIQPFAGGPRAAFASYDLDYWGNCMLPALEAIDSRSPQLDTTVTGWPLLILRANASRFPDLRLVDAPAEFSVELARGSPERLLALDRSPRLVHRVTTADGALLCAILRDGRLATDE